MASSRSSSMSSIESPAATRAVQWITYVAVEMSVVGAEEKVGAAPKSNMCWWALGLSCGARLARP